MSLPHQDLPIGAGLKLPSFPQHSVRVRYATEHRCGIVVGGPQLCDEITGTDPLKDNLPLQVSPTDQGRQPKSCFLLPMCLMLVSNQHERLWLTWTVLNYNKVPRCIGRVGGQKGTLWQI